MNRILLPFVALALTVGCAESGERDERTARAEAQIASLQAEMTKMGQRLGAMEKQVESHSLDIGSNEDRVSALSERVGWESDVAQLDPAKPGYSLARTDMGRFPVRFDKAEPYLDGHKLLFSIGNPTTASFEGMTFNLEFGKRGPGSPERSVSKGDIASFKKWADAEKEARASRRTVSVTVGKVIGSAAWTPVEIVVAPSLPEEIGYLSVGLEIDTLLLPNR